VTDANPLALSIYDGGASSQYGLLVGPGSATYIYYTVGAEWSPTSDNKYGVVQASWRSDGFELVRTLGADVYRIAGTYNGPRISGQWSVTESGTQMLAGAFNVSRSDGGGGTSGSNSSQAQPVGLNGEYNGTVSSSDANSTSGHIEFTVTGNSIQGAVNGQWAQAPSGDTEETPEQKEADTGTYSGTFSGTVDPSSGSFDTSLAGKIGDFDFTGHIRGTIQGNDASGTWDATNQYGNSSGKWRATRPAPAIPLLGGNGVGAEIVDSQPPGISGVGDVPGPQNLPETGTGILLPGLLAAAGIGLKSMLDSAVTPPPVVDYGPAVPDAGSPDGSAGFTDSMTDSPVDSTPSTAATDPSSAPAPQAAPPTSDYGPEYTKAMLDGQNATNEYNAMKQQLADFEQGADTTDPQYAILKKQYTDYLDYCKQKADDSAATADAIAQAVEKDRNTRVLKDYQGNDVKQVVYDPSTGQWHDSETGNLFDPDKWQQVQDQAAKDAAWSQADLQKIADHQDSFSKNLDQMVKDSDKKQAELSYLGKLQELAYDKNLTDPGGAHDVFVTTQNMMNDILDGKTVTVPQILETRQYLHDRLTGTAQPESSLSLPENQTSDWEIAKETAQGTIHELITGKDSDGHYTVAGVLGSIGLHIAGAVAGGTATAAAYLGSASGWASEAVLTATNALYSEKDALDHGATDWDAWKGGMWEGVKQGGLQAAGGLAVHYVPIYCPNVAAGIGEMMQPVNQLGQQISNLGQRINKLPQQVKNALFLSDELKVTRSALDKVLESGSDADLVKLYQNGGMAKLGDLQAAGGMTAGEAQVLNSRLAPIVNTEIDNSTRLAMQQFQSRTGVRIEQSIIADSGSSAQGPSSKAYTDFDRTQVTRFNQEDLAQYARDHSISVEEANQKLQNLYGNQITDNLDNSLRSQGFTHGIDDIHYSTYHGIGPGSGPGDCYGAGVTGVWTKTRGVGAEYNLDRSGSIIPTGVDADGNIIYSRQITGTAVVDQHGLNVHQVTGELPPNPDKFSPDEFQLWSRQQVNAANGHLDVKSVAKAMKRQSDLSDRINRMSDNEYGQQQLENAGIPTDAPVLDQNLTKLAKKIADNPSAADSILASKGLTPSQFQAQVSTAIENFHVAIGGTLN